jgi:hypothetical protein
LPSAVGLHYVAHAGMTGNPSDVEGRCYGEASTMFKHWELDACFGRGARVSNDVREISRSTPRPASVVLAPSGGRSAPNHPKREPEITRRLDHGLAAVATATAHERFAENRIDGG